MFFSYILTTESPDCYMKKNNSSSGNSELIEYIIYANAERIIGSFVLNRCKNVLGRSEGDETPH